ncbi:4-hydroxybenzoate octaprenyltransferase [Kangiella sp. TOML190]|uniref:4-hydroxybenzoate octaprenyltransferase n=1 Tax=Kangiella sp. TOML190 TaxID=2931351 RepID=UPI00203FE56D|nr:4-hydroxybenzoate octaprenyltransferase [Kangiella sp. TOML190]
MNKLKDYAQLMRLDKPIGIFLLLWPALWALWIAAEGIPDYWILCVFVLGVFIMRSAGCIINDYADRDFDAHVKRTKQRPLAQNKISTKGALALFFILVLMAFGLVLTLNKLTIQLSFIAVLLASFYPFMKRYTYFPQMILGAAFAWAIPMAFAAVTNQVPSVSWVLYAATLLWVLAYDTLYGMVDREDDIQLGLKSTAILFGEADLVLVALIQALFLGGMVLVGQRLELSLYYYAGVALAALLVTLQLYACRSRQPEAYFKAFLNNNYVGMVLFVGIAAHYALA